MNPDVLLILVCSSVTEYPEKTRTMSSAKPVSVMYSDTGTNFIAAKAQLNKIYSFLQDSIIQSDIKQELLKIRIKWTRIPSRAAHFGGLGSQILKAL